MDRVQSRLHEVFQKRLEQGDIDEDNVFNAEVDAFLARTRYLAAYGQLQVACARLSNAVGRYRPAQLPTAAIGKEVARRAAIDKLQSSAARRILEQTPRRPLVRACAPLEPRSIAGMSAALPDPDGAVKVADNDGAVYVASLLQKRIDQLQARGLTPDWDEPVLRIMAAPAGGGQWQFSCDNGGSWRNITIPLSGRVLEPSNLLRLRTPSGIIPTAAALHVQFGNSDITDNRRRTYALRLR